MPFALTIGVPYETFMHLVPNELRSFYKSYKQKQRIRDEEMWMYWGHYGISAFMFVIDRCFNKNPQYQYITKPILENYHKGKELTEEEKQKEVDRFYANNERMRKRWKMSHKK